MKRKWKPGGIWAGLWRNFPVPAMICLLLVAVLTLLEFPPFAYDSASKDNTLYVHINQLASALMLSLCVSTAASALLMGKRKLFHLILLLLGMGMVALHMLAPLPDNVLTGLVLGCILLSIFGVTRGNEPALRLNQIAGWFLTCVGVMIVLYIAVSGIQAAVTGLFFPEMASKSLSRITSILTSFVFLLIAPWLFLGGAKDCKNTWYHTFSSRVLLPLYLALMAVLLVYVGKSLVVWEMPVGTMNGFAIAAAALYVYFHLTLTGDETRLCGWFRKWGAWLMLPVLVAQAVGVYIRVDAYGFTMSRLMGVGVTAVCALCIISGLFRRRANWLLPLAAVALLALPYASERLAISDQENRLEAAFHRNNMIAEDGRIQPNANVDLEDRTAIYSALDYLLPRWSDFPENPGPLTERVMHQLEELLDESKTSKSFINYDNQKSVLLGFNRPNTTVYSYYWTFNGTAEQNRLDVAGFDYAEYLNFSQYFSTYDNEVTNDTSLSAWLANEENAGKEPPVCSFDLDLTALTDQLLAMSGTAFTFPEGPLVCTIQGETLDLRPLLEDITETSETMEDASRTFDLAEDRITLPSGKVLHLNRLQFYFYDNANGYVSISLIVEGWLMTPEAE